MITDQDAVELFKYIIENSEVESIFLTPVPSNTIEVKGLLDKIAELRNIDPLTNGKEYNEVMDNLKS